MLWDVFINHVTKFYSMPATNLAKLEMELGNNIHTEGVNIRLSKGTRLHNEIRRLLKKRHHVSAIKGFAML